MKKHIYIILTIILLAAALLGHGILTVWNRQVKVQQYEAETERLNFIKYACNEYDIPDGYKRVYVLGELEVDCRDSSINYIPSRDEVKTL